jgi:protein arginine N-methyltransferase 3
MPINIISDIDELDDVTNTNECPTNTENEKTIISDIHFNELQRTIQSLKAQLEQQNLAYLLAKQVCYI